MKIRTLAAAIALAGSLLAAAPASAAVVTLSFDGFKNGFEAGTVNLNGENISIHAGQFVFTVDNVDGTPPTSIGDKLAAFCVEVAIRLDQTGAQYLVESAGDYGFSADVLANVKQLYSQFYGSIGTSVTDAAFQLALWEIVFDTGAAYDLTSGNLTATAFNGARTMAAGWLAALGTGGDANLFTLRAPYEGWDFESQDLIFVPEPGTLALLGAGLVAFGAMRRRKLA